MAMTYGTSDAFGWSDLRTATRALDDTNAPRFEAERAATPPTTLGDIIAAGRPAVILAIVRDAHHERTLAKYLCEHHRFAMRSWVAYTAGSRQQVQFVHRDHMERAHGLRADVVVGQIPAGWTGMRLLDHRGMGLHVRGEQAERAFWGMAEPVAPPPPLAPVLTVDGHRCPASLWVNVAVHADSPHEPARTTVDISGEVADGDRFAARVESACRDRSVVVVGVALGDGKSTTLQGLVCSFGMAGRRLTAKLVCAPVRAKSAAPLSEAFFDTMKVRTVFLMSQGWTLLVRDEEDGLWRSPQGGTMRAKEAEESAMLVAATGLAYLLRHLPEPGDTKAGAAAGMIQSCLARLVLQEVMAMAQDAEIVRGFFEAVRPTMTDERKAMLRGALRELLADP